jgi:hypothetical protein
MTRTRIEVPTGARELSTPHFDDEATIITARPVVPIARAKAAATSRFLLWILPTALAASIFGALSAVGVNYLENRRSSVTQFEIKEEPQASQPPAWQLQVDEASPPDPQPPNGGTDTGFTTPEAASNSQAEPVLAGQEDGASAARNSASASNSREPARLTSVSPSAPAPNKNNGSADESSGLVRKRRVNPAPDRPSAPRPERSAVRKNRGAARITDIFEGPNYQ